MTNHMAEVAQMLGVELEEVFKVTDDNSGKYHNYYKFTEKKGIEVSEDNVKWEADIAGTLVLEWLLIGVARIIKLPWKPQKGETYYIPCIVAQPKYMYSTLWWSNDDYDKEYYRMGLVCKTLEEAIALTKKIISMVQKEKKNGQLHD